MDADGLSPGIRIYLPADASSLHVGCRESKKVYFAVICTALTRTKDAHPLPTFNGHPTIRRYNFKKRNTSAGIRFSLVMLVKIISSTQEFHAQHYLLSVRTRILSYFPRPLRSVERIEGQFFTESHATAILRIESSAMSDDRARCWLRINGFSHFSAASLISSEPLRPPWLTSGPPTTG